VIKIKGKDTRPIQWKKEPAKKPKRGKKRGAR